MELGSFRQATGGSCPGPQIGFVPSTEFVSVQGAFGEGERSRISLKLGSFRLQGSFRFRKGGGAPVFP